jgi:hypothetical protein
MQNTHIVVQAYTHTHKIEQLEEQRIQTMSDPKFQQWMRDMRVSQLYTSRELIHNANRLMKQYTHRIGEE